MIIQKTLGLLAILVLSACAGEPMTQQVGGGSAGFVDQQAGSGLVDANGNAIQGNRDEIPSDNPTAPNNPPGWGTRDEVSAPADSNTGGAPPGAGTPDSTSGSGDVPNDHPEPVRN